MHGWSTGYKLQFSTKEMMRSTWQLHGIQFKFCIGGICATSQQFIFCRDTIPQVELLESQNFGVNELCSGLPSSIQEQGGQMNSSYMESSIMDNKFTENDKRWVHLHDIALMMKVTFAKAMGELITLRFVSLGFDLLFKKLLRFWVYWCKSLPNSINLNVNGCLLGNPDHMDAFGVILDADDYPLECFPKYLTTQINYYAEFEALFSNQLTKRDDPKNEGLLQSFFNWFYASTKVSTIFALTVIVYI
ncbi:hypothetical protein NE237_024314 [Protea cynaroides]|uniref:Uncharacterized protein n=1 Tax=Protea cynaroides TaxID=273540 RepID=A0A9Q0HGP9_9MAGN|nr:hypothetical protein NE237_024314 [Protea cynaroides]